MTQDMEDLKGRIKEAAGDLTGNKKAKRSGKIDRASSATKQKVRQTGKRINLDDATMDKADDTIDRIKERAHDLNDELGNDEMGASKTEDETEF